jgi:hypothetical protein
MGDKTETPESLYGQEIVGNLLRSTARSHQFDRLLSRYVTEGGYPFGFYRSNIQVFTAGRSF